ncbi:Rne/Rng family ribonuclease [Aquabacter spiritensis]|uniref:Ribonuclease E n=1 Tax=Aquabacter spiritensis TaxID=933073 RepID=A0A4R3M489_9HYPH|nr:ribonuclease E/G [Aquabacter spiritensis]TCT08114.1 RNAse E [Aquabacter spiritensis]
MANKMLIDATHPEETRVVVVRGNRVEEFDYEAASRKQLRGNIYLAKVTRVEPSLQAAFVEYGGNRHGFLAFSEIHPDYYQIPVADRLALIEEEERAARQADEEEERRERRRSRPRRARRDDRVSERADTEGHEEEDADNGSDNIEEIDESDVVETIEDGQISGGHDDDDDDSADERDDNHGDDSYRDDHRRDGGRDEGRHIAEDMFAPLPPPQQQVAADDSAIAAEAPSAENPAHAVAFSADADERLADQGSDEAVDVTEQPGTTEPGGVTADSFRNDEAPAQDGPSALEARTEPDEDDEDEDDSDGDNEEDEVEQMGSTDALEEVPVRSHQRRARSYKIQEVIRRRQVMLVQVVKEERGNKGAALTTYLSLAGRYSVLMPNTARGGGISRKITNAVDRKRLKEVVQELEVPEGMGIILRTAGANRTKVEIKRDFEYLLRLWETVRELTLGSSAPSLVYEEGSLIKRAIRDLYNKDIDEVHVAGEEGYREARDFMRMLMPTHTKNVIVYRENQPIFAKYGVEHQLDAMFSPVVQLKSGGYIVINPTEALVSIDVNSGRATREHHIEDTALKTNMEASEEIARQLRLRDLAGLIVIDFIDMEEKRNNRSVERKLKDCLKNDRARIQVGRISHFGLMEMSRQRIRTGVLESSIEVCPTCGGTGHVRSAASVALQLLRALEEQLVRSASNNLVARTRAEVALYVLNQKRSHLRELEERFSVTLTVSADERVTGHQPFIIEKGDPAAPAPAAPRLAKVVQPDSILPDEEFEEEDEEIAEEATAPEAESEESEDREDRGEDGGARRKRRRRRRRTGDRDEPREARPEGEPTESEEEPAAEGEVEDAEDDERGEARNGDSDRRRRRRGRRGGRRNRREGEDGPANGEGSDEAGADEAASDEAASDEVGADEIGTEEEGKIRPLPDAPAEDVPTEIAAAPSYAAAETPEPPLAPAQTLVSPAAVEEAVAAKPARRRSTVREKAPSRTAPPAVSGGEDPAVEALAAPTFAEGTATPAAPLPDDGNSGEESASVPVADADMTGAREAAPSADPDAASAPPAEAPAPTEKPRSGWWQRKLFGG